MTEVARRLTTQGEERKQQLLGAAAHLFAERGYAETRVVDICHAAGVAKGLFYWYFDSKEAVFRELADDLRLRLRLAQAEALAPDADALTRLRQGTEASVRFMATHARSFALMAVENADRQFVDDLRRGTDVHAFDTRRLVEEGIAAGLVRAEDPEMLAIGVVSSVGSYAHHHRNGRGEQDVEELARFVGRFVVCSLAADQAAATAAIVGPTGHTAPRPGSRTTRAGTARE